jgi:hypothetical protein
MTGTVGMMRSVVIHRDGGRCVAPLIDPDAGPCYDRWGDPPKPYDVEIDYIERGASAPRHVLASDHASLCAGHHRGMGPQAGRVWALQSGRREQLREWLSKLA